MAILESKLSMDIDDVIPNGHFRTLIKGLLTDRLKLDIDDFFYSSSPDVSFSSHHLC